MGVFTKLFFDAEELVVLGHTVGTGSGTGLDLSSVDGNGEVSDGRIFGFTGTVGDHAGIAVCLGKADRVKGFGEGTDLVDLDEDGVRDAFDDAFAENRWVGDEEVVADELDLVAKAFGEFLPAFPIGFGKAVFDCDDSRIFFDHSLEITDHLLSGLLSFFGFDEVIDAVAFIEFGGSNVHTKEDLFAKLIASFLNRLGNEGERLFVALLAAWGESTFIANTGLIAVGFDDLLEGVEDFGSGAEGFAEGIKSGWDDEEFLEVDGGLSVGATIDDVHAWGWDDLSVGATDITVKWHVEAFGGCASNCEGDAK